MNDLLGMDWPGALVLIVAIVATAYAVGKFIDFMGGE